MSIDVLVNVTVKLCGFRSLLQLIATLPMPFRPTYFTVGERVRNKEASRIVDNPRFLEFVDERVERVSGCDLIGDKIRYGIFVEASRTVQKEPTHIGCSVIMRGAQWKPADYESLLRLLCNAPYIECADACMRAEWNHRHLCVKEFDRMSIQTTLGVDISAQLPGLYWWTVFSEELANRHQLDHGELVDFAEFSERWKIEDGEALYAYRLYKSPSDWYDNEGRVSSYLRLHSLFFSMARVQPIIDAAGTKDEFDVVVRPYRAGAIPWDCKKAPE